MLPNCVGVGQSELDIVVAADSTVVVLVPESGDSIQAMKAGLMEIADIFVVNKSDRDGAERVSLEIKQSLELNEIMLSWKPPIIKTVANLGQGVDQVIEYLQDHANYLKKNKLLENKRKRRIENYIKQIVEERLINNFWQSENRVKITEYIENIMNKTKTPYSVSEQLIEEFKR